MKLTRDRLKKIIKEELEEMGMMAGEKNPQAVLDDAKQRVELINAIKSTAEELKTAVDMKDDMKDSAKISLLLNNLDNLNRQLRALQDKAFKNLGI